MIKRILKIGFFGVFLMIASLFFGRAAFSQMEEEMKVLRMYFKEKDLVVISPTRHPKPVSQAAENITVITAEEIEAMNAHSVAEVLGRVPGLFINFNRDFGATSLMEIQGSESFHVRVMVDGVTWNFLNSGSVETNTIPVGIIERIEIIKGPASSAWGSALGGVVNIITKQAGGPDSERPAGSLRASWGERKTQDYRAEIRGRTRGVGYYLFSGFQDSEGLRSSRDFDRASLFGKVDLPLSERIRAGFCAGYSEPDKDLGDFPSMDLGQTGMGRAFLATAFLEASLSREFKLYLSCHHLEQKIDIRSETLGLGFYGPSGDLISEEISEEKTRGGSGRLIWANGIHTVVFGAEVERGKLDQTFRAGRFFQSLGVSPARTTDPDRDRWAVYLNDTIGIDRWSITPGIRYDYNDVTGSFLSPALGITCRLGKDSILRASAARGFTVPGLAWTSGGSLFIDPNPSLDNESVWSYQAGAESSALTYLWLKATWFRHEVEDTLIKESFPPGPPAANDLIVNKSGEVRRQGFELEAQTAPFYNLSLGAGFCYVDTSPSDQGYEDSQYSYSIGIRYDDRKSFRGELFGRCVWWDLGPAWKGEYDDIIWDLNLNKEISSKKKTIYELFFSVHNLLNGSHYLYVDDKNPRRWLEAGIRIRF